MNDRARRLISIFFGVPVYVAFAVFAVIVISRLEGSARVAGIFVLLALLLAAFILYLVRTSRGNRQVAALLDILYKEADPEKFISASEEVLGKTRNRALRNTLLLNLAVGYAAAGKYDDAIRAMKEVPIDAADKESKAMYYCNVAAFYAEKGALDAGLEAYREGLPYFEKTGAAMPMAHLRFTRGLLHFAEGEYEEALEVFETAKNRGFSDRHTMTRLQLFEARAHAALGHVKEARQIYGKILQKKTYPFYLQSAKEELARLDKFREK